MIPGHIDSLDRSMMLGWCELLLMRLDSSPPKLDFHPKKNPADAAEAEPSFKKRLRFCKRNGRMSEPFDLQVV
jgi:hypothetical protein